MLPSAKTHLADLRDKSASIVSHLDGLARQWDAVRLPLETEVREKTRRRDGRRQRAAELVAESRAVKAETADMLQDLKVMGTRTLWMYVCMYYVQDLKFMNVCMNVRP